MCFEGLARLSRRVWRRFVRGSREISLVPSLHRASTDTLISLNCYFFPHFAGRTPPTSAQIKEHIDRMVSDSSANDDGGDSNPKNPR